jgi:histidinol-phosphate/aromatic aminotransferase/cobyric acid decarboxylase-like protein
LQQDNEIKPPKSPQTLTIATKEDHEQIYRVRHEVYASELGQHSKIAEAALQDDLDFENHYLVVKHGPTIVGFVSITPPSAKRFSIEKYFHRDQLPFQFSESLYEVRLLTVVEEFRQSSLFLLLGHAAFRWVAAHGGTHVCGMGRQELIPLYERCGMEFLPFETQSGAVTYRLMHAPISKIARQSNFYADRLKKSVEKIRWQLPFLFSQPSPCFHGGAFFASVGERFGNLERHKEIINADVLDAWFPPAPGVIDSLKKDLPWLLRTSPPTDCAGLIAAIADTRRVNPDAILPGAGSSDLIFRAFPHWLDQNSRVLLLDPTYGEYRHILERVIGCRVSSFQLMPEDSFKVNLALLEKELTGNYDLIVLVNPNSPTGQIIPAHDLKKLLKRAPASTRIWLDETYVDYVSPAQSLESFAATSENIIVCKSMSKSYALSGARVAYLCAGPHQLESLRLLTPPWVIGLPSQLAAVRALENPAYYERRYAETRALCHRLEKGLTALGWSVFSSVANFLLCQLPESGPTSDELILACRKQNLFLRNPGNMGGGLHERAIRIAVKDAPTNARILEILSEITTVPQPAALSPASLYLNPPASEDGERISKSRPSQGTLRRSGQGGQFEKETDQRLLPAISPNQTSRED